ncbi:MAG: enolase-phosphatase [Chloroflexota bacterium]|nr:enolase-phosphatase [Chloroflexota bacterium]
MQWRLFDIEGTITSLAFVKDELYPYARRAIPAYLSEHAADPEVRPILDRLAGELGVGDTDVAAIGATLQRWIDEDRKHPELKELQGMVWAAGYRDGAHHGHLYADVVPYWERARAAGLRLAIYSSGSVQAQQLLLEHSTAGDVSYLVEQHFDTRVGAKTEAASYERIAAAMAVAPTEIRFYSDVVAELDAANAVGVDTCRLLRPGVPRVAHRHREIEDFAGEHPT